jgi:hypothetical protein
MAWMGARSFVVPDTTFRSTNTTALSSTYVRKLKPVLQVQDPSAYFNDIPVDFGAGFFELLNSMTDTVGAMQFTIGLSMRNIKGDFDKSLKNVVDLAKDAKKMLGGRLDSLLLGNVSLVYLFHSRSLLTSSCVGAGPLYY